MSVYRHMDLTGDRALMQTLEQLRYSVQRRVLSGAAQRSMKPVVTAAKRNVKKTRTSKRGQPKTYDRTGLLAKSIGTIVRKYRHSAVAVAITGPRINAATQERGRLGHLVEEGHRLVVHGKDAGRVPGYPFMRPAWDAQRGQVQSRVAKEIRVGLDREAKRAARKAGVK